MRKIKVAVFLAIMVLVLSVISVEAVAEGDNESDNICRWYPQPFIKIGITAKKSYDGEVTKHQFPAFEQSDILFVTSLEVINRENCTPSQFSISFPIISPTGKKMDTIWGPFYLNKKLMPYETYIFENLDEIGTWAIESAHIEFNNEEYGASFYLKGYDQYRYSRRYIF